MSGEEKDYVDVFFDDKYRPLTENEVEEIGLSTSILAKAVYKPFSKIDTYFSSISSIASLFGAIFFWHKYEGKIEHVYIAGFAFVVLINMLIIPIPALFKRLFAYGTLLGYKNNLFKKIKDNHIKNFTDEDYKLLDKTVNLDEDEFAAYRIIKMYDPLNDKYVYVSFESNRKIKIIAPEQAGFLALYFNNEEADDQGILTPFIPKKGDASSVKYHTVEEIGDGSEGFISFVDLKNCNAIGQMDYSKKNSVLAYIEELGSSRLLNIFYYPTKEMYQQKRSQFITIDFTNGNRVMKHGSYVKPKYDFDSINVNIAKKFFTPKIKKQKGENLIILIPMAISIILGYLNIYHKHDITLFTKIAETSLVMACSFFPIFIILKSFIFHYHELISFYTIKISNTKTGSVLSLNIDKIVLGVLYAFALNYFFADYINSFASGYDELMVKFIKASFIVAPFMVTYIGYSLINFICSKMNKPKEKKKYK